MTDSLVHSPNILTSRLSSAELLTAIERGIASDEPLAKRYGNRITYSSSINGNTFKIGKRLIPKQCFSRQLHGQVTEFGSGSRISYRFALTPYYFLVILPFILLGIGICVMFSIATGQASPQFSLGSALMALLLALSTPLTRRYEETALTKYLKGILEART